MNKLSKILNYFMMVAVVASLAFMMSCGDDDPIIIPKEEGIPVADGFYVTQAGVDPVSKGILVAEQVADDGFASQDRDGFYGTYAYLEAGSYNIVTIASKAITETYGGTIETVTNTDASLCGFDDVSVASVAIDGAAFSVSAGLYKIGFDKTLGEAVFYKIEKAGLIGTATDFGWGGDTELALDGTITADGATWKGVEINIKEGEYKLRFNCRWDVSRRIDPDGGLGFDNGFVMFTNFAGASDNLVPGNAASNIPITAPEQAQYTITVSWTPKDGFTMAFEKTGEYVPPAFDPAEHPWSIRGTAGTDWDPGLAMTYKGLDGATHTWAGVFELGSKDGAVDGSGEFKVADGGTWLGVGLVTDNTGGLLEGSDNFIVSTGNDGFYYFVVQTDDEGATYTASVAKASFGIIGDATPTGWDSDTDMVESGSSFTLDIALTAAGGWKFRANDDWVYNLGGDITGLTVNGDNLSVTSDATYTVTLTTADKGLTYSATVE